MSRPGRKGGTPPPPESRSTKGTRKVTPDAAPVGTTEATMNILFPKPWKSSTGRELLPHQECPIDPFDLWVLMAGRGAGKTEACSHYFAKYMHQCPEARGRIIAPTLGDAVEACIEGPSGLKRIDPEVSWHPNAVGGAKVAWPNGSEALVIGTPFPKDVDRLRAGGNRELDWWEEMAANAQLKEAWDQAAFGLRLAEHTRPHSIASTTPRNTTDFRAILKIENTVITHASLFDNPHNPADWVAKMRKKYEGTRLGRQELRGELLDDIEGALWNRLILDSCRLQPELDDIPEMVLVAVAIDPAVSTGEDSADTGIMIGGIGTDGLGYLLNDITCHLGPDGWGKRAVRAYYHYDADYIIGEVNNGGNMIEHVIATIDNTVPFHEVHASRGKQIRAEPVATLYGNGSTRPPRIRHLGSFPELEDQLCTWVPGEGDKSPDRMDALVWLFSELFFAEVEEDTYVEEWEPVRIGADI
jgi:phage terminase large subunit-like protein